MTFPVTSVEDMVVTQALLLDHLGVNGVHASVGASLGGMQSIMMAALFPSRVGRYVFSVHACCAVNSIVQGGVHICLCAYSPVLHSFALCAEADTDV